MKWKGQSRIPTGAVFSSYAPPSFTEHLLKYTKHLICCQIDTLSADEFILQQFQADYPHLKKLHKRTDNAAKFSSHGTPEAEKIICKRVSF